MNTSNDLKTHLENIGSLNESEKSQIIACIDELKIKRNQYYGEKGQKQKCIGFLSEGFMRVYQTDESGDKKIMHFIQPGNFIATTAGITPNKAFTANIQALADCRIQHIACDDLECLKLKMPTCGLLVGSFNEHFYKNAVEILHLVRNGSLEERYGRLLNSIPELKWFASAKDIASFLGVTHFSLSRIRNSKI